MRSKDVIDWAMYNQITLKHKAPHRKACLVERHNALIRSASQFGECQAIKESFCVSSNTASGLVTFMKNVLVSINNRTPYQAFSRRQPHLPPFLEGG